MAIERDEGPFVPKSATKNERKPDQGVVHVSTKGAHMPKDTHNKAAEHHENAAKSHRTAAEHHGKGDHAKGHEHSTMAQQHSKTARDHSETAHKKSGEHAGKK
jgi:hypothetical protein